MITYKKVGGIHFVRVLRFGFNFYWSRKARVSKRETVEPLRLLTVEPLRLLTVEPLRLLSVRLPDGRRVFRVA